MAWRCSLDHSTVSLALDRHCDRGMLKYARLLRCVRVDPQGSGREGAPRCVFFSDPAAQRASAGFGRFLPRSVLDFVTLVYITSGAAPCYM
jgi:hypothetical protein